jgi:hypothetical protein
MLDKFLADNDMTATSPAPCQFVVGASVFYTNDYGVKFGPYKVIGYAKTIEWGRFVHLDFDSPWFPVSPSSLSWI